MIQLLVVDDYPDQVEAILSILPLEELGIGEAFRAYSGMEALEVLRRTPVDIVITDIKMPGMSGLELISRIRETSGSTKCILLSGYAEFEYAKQAITLQTSYYLTKPVLTAELISIMRSVIASLKAEWEEISSRQRALRTFQEHLPLLRGELLNQLLLDKRIPPAILEEKLHMLELPFALQDRVYLLLVRLEEDFAELDDYDLSLMEYGIANIAEEIFGKRCLIWEGKDSYGYLVFVLKEKDCAEFAAEAERSMEQIEQAAVSLHHNVRLYLKRSISVCLVKKRGVFPSGIGALHRAGVRAICREISGESDFFLSVEGEQDQEQEQTRGIRGCLQELYQPPLMSQLLDMGQWDKAEQKLVDIFTELEIKWIESAEYIQECYCALAGSFYYFAHRNGYRLEEPLYAEAASSPDILMAPSMRQLRQWAVATCRRLREEAENSTRKSRSHIVALVHRFISSNLAGELTLQTISDHIKLHPAYLSKMYKAETGIGLSDYLLRCRMEEAARLLRSTNGKIYEIASETGYLTPHYFIKLFKSYYGVTPQEYREKLPD